MSDDHRAVDEVLKQLLTASNKKDVQAAHAKLDLLWARLFGYTVASVVAFGAIVFRYAIWLQRPATRVYWRRGWKLYLQREKFAQNTANAAKTLASCW